ncbi:MAG: hypothetical protein OXF44_00340 [Anaerolineaceae bacterium]|nr:hypothetical protein [Anaerolineaceae bacterium]MCY4023338.1 hypothetical protein [Anaerolineaceae bacterium]
MYSRTHPHPNPTLSFEYDTARDVLHVMLEPYDGSTYFLSLDGFPDVFLRHSDWDKRCVGISLKYVSRHLERDAPTAGTLRQLADRLVAQHAPVCRKAGGLMSRRVLDDNPAVTWKYHAFGEILYVNLRRDIGHTDYDTADDDPDVIVRRDPQENDRVVGFMVERIPRRFGTDMPDDEALRALARELIARYAPEA